MTANSKSTRSSRCRTVGLRVVGLKLAETPHEAWSEYLRKCLLSVSVLSWTYLAVSEWGDVTVAARDG